MSFGLAFSDARDRGGYPLTVFRSSNRVQRKDPDGQQQTRVPSTGGAIRGRRRLLCSLHLITINNLVLVLLVDLSQVRDRQFPLVLQFWLLSPQNMSYFGFHILGQILSLSKQD